MTPRIPHPRLRARVGVVVVLLGLLVAAGGLAAEAQQPVAHEAFRKVFGLRAWQMGELPRPPALATSEAELAALWDRYAFNVREGVSPGTPLPPPQPPRIDFDDNVAVVLVDSAATRLDRVTRDGRSLRLHAVAEDGVRFGTPQFLGVVVRVPRAELPASPFTVVQSLEGEVRHRVEVSLTDDQDGELPRTGLGPWVLALAAGSVVASVGVLAVAWARRRGWKTRAWG